MFLLWDIIEWILFLTAAFVLWSLLSRLRLNLRYKNLPPGPFCWPILGYLPFLDKQTGHKSLQKLAAKFGGVFSLYVGSRYVVIIDDFDALKTAISREEFLGRPEEALFISPDHSQESLLNMSGDPWMVHRKFWLNMIRYMSVGERDVKQITMAQIRDVLNTLKKNQGKDIRADRLVDLALNNVSFYLNFGKTFDQSHEIIKQLGSYDESILMHLNQNGLQSFFPWLGYLVNLLPMFKKVRENLDVMDKITRKEISEHLMTLDENNPRDFTDLFLIQMQKPGAEVNFNTATLLGGLKLLLVAAGEGTRNTLVWFLLLMAKYPEVQERIQAEIDNFLGREREPELTDRNHLPLLDATIMESMRFRNVMHLNLPRRVSRDTKLCDYDIPEGTIVIFNMSSHNRNIKYWKDPNQFYPERFISADRKSVQIPEHFVPFSYGKRNCVGERIANSTIFLFSVSIMQKFTVLPAAGGVNLNVKVNFTNGHEEPFVRFQER